jgi:lipoprotein signal peptidase
MSGAARRRYVAVGAALGVATIDLAEAALDGGALRHHRSGGALLLMLAVAIALLFVVPRLPSLPVAVGGGVAAGGALGNLTSGLVWWGSGIPDPLVLRGLGGGVAFNLADVSLFLGDALLLCAAAVHALRNRGRLRRAV